MAQIPAEIDPNVFHPVNFCQVGYCVTRDRIKSCKIKAFISADVTWQGQRSTLLWYRHGAEQYAGDLECVFYGYHLDRAILKIVEAAYCLMPSLLWYSNRRRGLHGNTHLWNLNSGTICNHHLSTSSTSVNWLPAFFSRDIIKKNLGYFNPLHIPFHDKSKWFSGWTNRRIDTINTSYSMHDRKESLQLACACQHWDVIFLNVIALGLAPKKNEIVWMFSGPAVDASDAATDVEWRSFTALKFDKHWNSYWSYGICIRFPNDKQHVIDTV